MFEISGKYTTALITVDEIDELTLCQIYSMTNHPAFTNKIVIQPDTHAGKGSVIGFTMELSDKIIPNVIGVDIGCSIQSVNIQNIILPLSDFDKEIRRSIPFGFNIHKSQKLNINWKQLNEQALSFHNAYQQRFNTDYQFIPYSEQWLHDKLKMLKTNEIKFYNSIGTLGGGNHFIEVSISENTGYWLTVHTGSRNFGKCVCEFWQKQAKQYFTENYFNIRNQQLQEIKSSYPKQEIQQRIKQLPSLSIPEEQLWLEGKDAYLYCYDMFFALYYANLNRTTIINKICNIVKTEYIDSVTSIHNYIDFTDFIIRKGAIRAYANERMVIPFNMRDGILICEGKSNATFNYSGPHGAGRVLSRSKAKEQLSLHEFKTTMKDIYSSSVNQHTLDEAPDAYKDHKVIESAIQDTTTIIDRLKPIMNLKDATGKA